MKIILLCSTQPNQMALANKIAGAFNLIGIVIEKKIDKKKYTLKKVFNKIADKLFFNNIIKAWQQMLQYYKNRYKDFPDTNQLKVTNVNQDEVVDYIKTLKPDLIMVSGTSLLKKNILNIQVPLGIINLHTGLSPFVKGAPNCTNWCIAKNQFHLIGNSIMWIDAGIDSGDLLSTAIVKFIGNESLLGVHIKVMEEAHALYLNALESIKNNTSKRVKQNKIADGVTYYSKDWGFSEKLQLIRNFKNFKNKVNKEIYLEKIASTYTV